jgi:hypothetical protein
MPHIVHDTIRSTVPRATHSDFFHRITLPHPTRRLSFLDAPAGTVVEVSHPDHRHFFHQEEVEVNFGNGRRMVARPYLHVLGQWLDEYHRPITDVPQAVRDLAAGVGTVLDTPILDRSWYKVIDRTGTVVGLWVAGTVHPIQSDWQIGDRSVSLRRLTWPDNGGELALLVPGYCDDVAYLESVPEF